MRRAGPILILVIGLAALVINFWPNLTIPDSSSTDGTWRLVETRLGLVLQAGLRAEYQRQPVAGRSPTPGDLAVIKDMVDGGGNTTGVSEPWVRPQGTDRGFAGLRGVP